MTALARTLLAFAALIAAAADGRAAMLIKDPWPDPGAVGSVETLDVRYPSTSPFSPYDLGRGGEHEPASTTIARLYRPPSAAPKSLPAVVMLHGAGGLVPGRFDIYGPQLASMGVAVLAIDTF